MSDEGGNCRRVGLISKSVSLFQISEYIWEKHIPSSFLFSSVRDSKAPHSLIGRYGLVEIQGVTEARGWDAV
jgi:hypothetical protein